MHSQPDEWAARRAARQIAQQVQPTGCEQGDQRLVTVQETALPGHRQVEQWRQRDSPDPQEGMNAQLRVAQHQAEYRQHERDGRIRSG